ncbi:MAG: DUF3800 domain-containing protein [Acidobacteriia bacterium]|nr:DUF3800 domain-containing protein [Terriglobia bacterium]
MPNTFNIYCDESCHLEHDRQPIMVLGAVWCPTEKSREIAVRIRELKQRHGISRDYEIKWERVSPGKLEFYLDVVDYFFDDDHLNFRAYVAAKHGLRHEEFGQDHDTWYFKMYFHMLALLLDPESRYRIYLDIKDSRSAAKIAKLHDVLCNNIYDFQHRIIERVQTVESKHVQQVQLTDLLVGAVSYANRNLQTSKAKLAIVDRIQRRSGYSLTGNTLMRAQKVNLFHWYPQGAQHA